MNKPFNDYHRRALGSMARDIARAQAERETAEVLARAKQPLPCSMCPDPKLQGRDTCNGSCETAAGCDCFVVHAEQPSPAVRTWLAEESNAMAAMLPPTLWQRLMTRLRLFVDGWLDPTVRS
jgi:hypothetical protein